MKAKCEDVTEGTRTESRVGAERGGRDSCSSSASDFISLTGGARCVQDEERVLGVHRLAGTVGPHLMHIDTQDTSYSIYHISYSIDYI